MTIQRHDEGVIATLTIDRPQRRNALGENTVRSLRRALDDIDADASIRATIITGSAPGFCAGSDLKELATMDMRGMCEHEAETAQFCRYISQLNKPVIAAVEGFALGGGFIFAASCDLVVSAENCRWHLPEVQIGWIPPWGLQTLAARLGPVVARRVAWGAQHFDGHEAYRIGLADYLTPDGQTLATALSVAQGLAALPDVAVQAVKQYFAPHAGLHGEAGDAVANRMFAENCKFPVAVATLEKFGVRK